MKIWDSESDELCDYKEDEGYIEIDKDNGVLILTNYELTGSHTTTLMFVGPNEDANARKWAKWVERHDGGDDGDEYNINTDTEEAIKSCFG